MFTKKCFLSTICYFITGVFLFLFDVISNVTFNTFETSVFFYFAFIISAFFYIYSYIMIRQLKIKLFDIWFNVILAFILCFIQLLLSIYFHIQDISNLILLFYLLNYISLFFLYLSKRLEPNEKNNKHFDRDIPNIRTGVITVGYNPNKIKIIQYWNMKINYSKFFRAISKICFLFLLFSLTATL